MTSRPAPWQVLIVEPPTGSECLPETHLHHLEQHKCTFHRMTSLGGAVSLLRKESPQIILLNPNFGEDDPLETFELVHRSAPAVPVIVLIRPNQTALGGQMIASGAVDYFTSGSFDPWKLEKRLRREIRAYESETQLTQEGALLRALLDSIPDRIYFKDRESRFLRVSRALAEFFHAATPDEMIGTTDADYFDDAHATAARNDELNILQSGQPLINRLERETFTDGRIGWALSTKVPFRTPGGRIIGTLGISRDVTDLYTMQAALTEERSLLRTLIDALPDIIYVKDAASHFLLANASCARLIGIEDPEKIVGKWDYDYFPREFADRYYADEQRVIETGEPLLDREEQVRRADGSVFWVLTTKIPIRDAEGRVAGLVGIGRDMTRFRKLEEEAEHLRTRLDEASLPA